MKSINILFTVLAMAVFFAACQKDEVKPLPEVYEINESSVHPEGIAFSRKEQKLFAGSYVKGKVLSIALDGYVSDFVTDGSLVTVVGLAIDETQNRLIVCNSDGGLSQRSKPETIGQLAELRFYDLRTGDHLRTVDLSSLYVGGHFINDVIVDANGNVYATDSFSPVIYKVDNDYNASVLVQDDQFQVPSGQFGLNGIVYHPNNYLIVGMGTGGKLYKVDLSNSNRVENIPTNISLNSTDGLLLTDKNKLVAVSNNFSGAPYQEAVYEIESDNDWTSATVKQSFSNFEGSFPTTVADVNGTTYVSHANFPELVTPDIPEVTRFVIQKVQF